MSALMLAITIGLIILLVLILVLKIHAFLALLCTSILVGLLAGLPPDEVIMSVQNGLGGTLGFVATVVGLGAIFGGILEHSGGAKVMVDALLKGFGEKNTPWAMLLAGFLIAIPVFFDVAFIILMPILYRLQRKTKASLLLYAIPLLSGLAITHAFIPPTPGPIAVAEIIGADLGWVMILGFGVGIPCALLSGLVFGKYIATKISVSAPPLEEQDQVEDKASLPSIYLIIGIIFLPIGLILSNTLLSSGLIPLSQNHWILSLVKLLGHPFSALIIANLMAWLLLGLRQGFSKEDLLKISAESFKPAGVIVLVTGAGGAFKQVLIDTGIGKLLAQELSDWNLPILVFVFIAALLVRILQGSATVAMITAAGLSAPLIGEMSLSSPELAALVIAIAAGASSTSHVNDSGFWLVKEYLGLSEKETFQAWTTMTTLLAFSAFGILLILDKVFF